MREGLIRLRVNALGDTAVSTFYFIVLDLNHLPLGKSERGRVLEGIRGQDYTLWRYRKEVQFGGQEIWPIFPMR